MSAFAPSTGYVCLALCLALDRMHIHDGFAGFNAAISGSIQLLQVACRKGLSSVLAWCRSPRGPYFSLLVQRKVGKRNTPQAARPAHSAGSAGRPGIFVRHIHAPYENAAHPGRRPDGFTRPARRAWMGPKSEKSGRGNSNRNGNNEGRSEAATDHFGSDNKRHADSSEAATKLRRYRQAITMATASGLKPLLHGYGGAWCRFSCPLREAITGEENHPTLFLLALYLPSVVPCPAVTAKAKAFTKVFPGPL